MDETDQFDFPAAPWRLIDDGAYRAQLGLAIDDMLLERMDSNKGGQEMQNTIRFYQFAPPSVVVGCHQDIREIDLGFVRERNLQLGRRITGGGAIIMGVPDVEAQLGVSILFRNAGSFPGKLGSRYAALSRPILAALRQLGLPVAYQANSDITLHGRKITGQAMFSTANVIFMHSTITIDYDLDTMLRVMKIPLNEQNRATLSARYTTIKSHLPCITMEQVKNALRAGFEREYNARLVESPLDEEELRHARDLLEEKHATDAYLLDMDGTSMGSCFL